MKNFPEKVQENGPAGRKRYDRKSTRIRQKNKRVGKVESNDSSEISDRGGETSDIPGLLLGVDLRVAKTCSCIPPGQLELLEQYTYISHWPLI